MLRLQWTSLGLGSRWFNIAGIINLPENLDVECIIAIGYPDEELRYNQVNYGKTLIEYSLLLVL